MTTPEPSIRTAEIDRFLTKLAPMPWPDPVLAELRPRVRIERPPKGGVVTAQDATADTILAHGPDRHPLGLGEALRGQRPPAALRSPPDGGPVLALDIEDLLEVLSAHADAARTLLAEVARPRPPLPTRENDGFYLPPRAADPKADPPNFVERSLALRQSPPLQGAPAGALADWALHGRCQWHEPGRALLSTGTTTDAALLLLDGRATLRDQKDKRRTATPGDFLDLPGTLSGPRHRAGFDATTPCLVLSLPMAKFDELLAVDFRLGRHLWGQWFEP